jgi:hypothetical protein
MLNAAHPCYAQVADYDNFVPTLEKMTRSAMATLDKTDWRLLFVLVDILLLFETGNAGKTLDKLVSAGAANCKSLSVGAN